MGDMKTVPLSLPVAVCDWLAARGGQNFRSMRGEASAIICEQYRAESGKKDIGVCGCESVPDASDEVDGGEQ